MSQKSASLSPGIIISPNVKGLFPLILTRPGTTQAFEFQTAKDLQSHLESLSGYYSVYRKGQGVVVDKYVIGAGMYTVFQSEAI
jgi:hypothetical protein